MTASVDETARERAATVLRTLTPGDSRWPGAACHRIDFLRAAYAEQVEGSLEIEGGFDAFQFDAHCLQRQRDLGLHAGDERPRSHERGCRRQVREHRAKVT